MPGLVAFSSACYNRALCWRTHFACYIAMRWCCGASSIEPAEPLTAEQLAEKQEEAEPVPTREAGPRPTSCHRLKRRSSSSTAVTTAHERLALGPNGQRDSCAPPRGGSRSPTGAP